MNSDNVRPAPSQSHASSGTAGDLAVPPAMLVVAVACGLACHMHFGFAPEFAAAIGLTLFCIMLLCHVLLRPGEGSEPMPVAASSDVTSPLAQVKRPTRLSAGPQPSARSSARMQALKAAPATTAPPPVQPPPAPARTVPDMTVAQKTAAVDAELPVEPSPVSEPPARAVGAAGPSSFRPLSLQLPVRVDAAAERGSPTAAVQPAAVSALRPTITDDAASTATTEQPVLSEQQRIEQILKRLATQIRSGGQITPPPLPAAAQAGPEPDAPAAQGNGIPAPLADAIPDSALESAVNTLRSTVEAMRHGLTASGNREAPPAARTPTRGWDDRSVPATEPESANEHPARMPTAAEIRIAAVAEALAAERANVFLQPILVLKEENARHFEVSVRLRGRDGQVMERQHIAHQIRGAGLLPLLDAIGVRHSAGFALKLERRGRDGAVFSQVAGESLESADFVGDIAARQAQGIADRLILSFDQDEIGALGAAQMAALARLNELGFRFAIERLSHLDMDFEALSTVGFAFVKLDADVFSQGLALSGTTVPAGELCNYFREFGLAVIVGRIEDEAVRRRMLDFGVVFGQGGLFGQPRPVPIGTLDIGDEVAA